MKRNGRLKTEAAMNILYNLSYQKICLAYLCSTSSSIGEGNGNPLRYSCLENPMDGGSRRVGHDWATSLSLFTFMHWRGKWQPTPVFLPGEFQGRGATVYGKAQSWTWLKRLSSSSSSKILINRICVLISWSPTGECGAFNIWKYFVNILNKKE